MINYPDWQKPKIKLYLHQISLDCIEKLIECVESIDICEVVADTCSGTEKQIFIDVLNEKSGVHIVSIRELNRGKNT